MFHQRQPIMCYLDTATGAFIPSEVGGCSVASAIGGPSGVQQLLLGATTAGLAPNGQEVSTAAWPSAVQPQQHQPITTALAAATQVLAVHHGGVPSFPLQVWPSGSASSRPAPPPPAPHLGDGGSSKSGSSDHIGGVGIGNGCVVAAAAAATTTTGTDGMRGVQQPNATATTSSLPNGATTIIIQLPTQHHHQLHQNQPTVYQLTLPPSGVGNAEVVEMQSHAQRPVQSQQPQTIIIAAAPPHQQQQHQQQSQTIVIPGGGLGGPARQQHWAPPPPFTLSIAPPPQPHIVALRPDGSASTSAASAAMNEAAAAAKGPPVRVGPVGALPAAASWSRLATTTAAAAAAAARVAR
jgi:hypothetical protein